MENIHFKFQILFVFGYGLYGYKPTDEDIEKWKKESTTHRDLIVTGSNKIWYL